MNISVVVACFNHRRYVKQAVESIIDQAWLDGFEIIVVDDRSTDGTYEYLKSLNKEIEFKLLRTRLNSGPSAARNIGIKASQGELVAFLDGDDYWLNDRLSKTIGAYKSDPGSVVFSDAFFQYGSSASTEKQSSIMPPSHGLIIEQLFRRNFINLCSVLMPTALAKKIKFDESLRSAEDYDFWLRVAADGTKFIYLDEPLVVYRRSEANLSANRLHSIACTQNVLDKNARLAKSTKSERNLSLHKINLLEEKLQVISDPVELRQTLKQLERLRQLGKRENLVKNSLIVNKRLGRVAQKRFLK